MESTFRDLLILAKEDIMTNKKAISSIENHIQNERNLNFKQKQEKSTLVDFLKQLPDKTIKPSNEENLDEFYDYEPKTSSRFVSGTHTRNLSVDYPK